MIKINLLSPESIKPEERKDFLLLGGLVGIAAFLFCAIYFLKLSVTLSDIESQTARMQAELNKYEGIVRQVDALRATKNSLEAKKIVIDNLVTSRLFYPVFMENFLNLMPSNLWFKSLTTQFQTSDKISIILESDALDIYSIADLITALSASPNFDSVIIGPITTNYTDKSQTSSFRLNFNYQRSKQ